MRTIAIVNQKGGCGKTTTAINLAALYAKRGLRTLLVDMDPQSHCAAGLGVPEARIEYSIGDALLADHSNGVNASSLVWEVARNLHLAPSTVMLAALEAPGGGLHQLPDKDRRLESLLNHLADHYDRCLIDCPPTIGLLTFNAMRAAREALIPVETGFFSLRGAEKQWTTIQRMIAHIGRPMACHLVATLHNPQSQLACNILAALRRQFAGQILPTVIHVHEVLREAASLGQPVLEYAPDSSACQDFQALADWLEEHAASPTVQIEIMAAQAFPAMTGPQSRALSLLEQEPVLVQRRELFSPIAPHAAHATNGTDSPIASGGRAAEVVRRVHDLAARSREIHASEAAVATCEAISLSPLKLDPKPVFVASAPFAVRPSPLKLQEIQARDETAREGLAADAVHLYGVKQTSRGVLFVQPAHGAASVCIAGDFNHWSPTANPLRLNDQLGVFEAIFALPPGTYQYRVVIDGEWLADPHNNQQQLNTYGEPNSMISVT